MARKLKIGIVGTGAIGSSLARAIVKDFSKSASLVSLFDKDAIKAKRISYALMRRDITVGDMGRLISRSELVIECASSADSWNIANACLRKGRDVMLMSVGGLIGRLKALKSLAAKFSCRVFIPSGAISGLDAVKASAMGRIKEVTLTTRKHPCSFKGVKYIRDKKINLDAIRKDKLLFSGRAREAVKYFPQNINVAAALSLAGIGQEKTRVRIIATPGLKKNVHEISIISDAGSVFTRTENVLHPSNPKTSYLAVLSAIANLKQILEPVVIGS